MADLARLRSALALAYAAGIKVSMQALVRALKTGRAVDVILVRAAIRRMANQTWAITEQMYGRHFRNVLGSDFKNYQPLAELLKERQVLHASRLNGYSYLYDDSAKAALLIGRRTQDAVRELTLQELERGFIYGQPATLQRDNLKRIMIARGREDLARDIENGLDPRRELVDKVALFHENGEARFYLRERSGKFRSWSVDSYAQLVANTTAEEADRIGTVEKARLMGTRLVQFSSTGKGKAYYISIGDLRCAAIDGVTASIEPGGTWLNGKFYPFWRDLLPGPYVSCHPNCQHKISILSEALAA